MARAEHGMGKPTGARWMSERHEGERELREEDPPRSQAPAAGELAGDPDEDY